MKFFQYFSSDEFFPNCDDLEIVKCINKGYFDSLLVLIQFVDNFRDFIACPIILTSTFRGISHNERVGGSTFSQHMYGCAIDFIVKDKDFEEVISLFNLFIEKCALEKYIGQVIFYHKRKFIHLGLRTQSHKKLQILHYEKRDN